MSSMASAWAFDQRGIPPSEKLILFLLAECHDPCSGVVDSSIDWLADHSNLPAPQVRTIVDSLRRKGFLGEGFALNIAKPRRVA